MFYITLNYNNVLFPMNLLITLRWFINIYGNKMIIQDDLEMWGNSKP